MSQQNGSQPSEAGALFQESVAIMARLRGPGGCRRSLCLCPQPGRLGLGELRQDLSGVNGGGLLQRRADKHRRLADERVKRHERVLCPRR